MAMRPGKDGPRGGQGNGRGGERGRAGARKLVAALDRGWRHLDDGDLDAAEQQAGQALALDASCGEAHGLLAEVAAARGDLERAEAELRLQLELEPDADDALLALGDLLLPSDPAEAAALAARALTVLPEEDPELAEPRLEAHLLAARAQMALGEPEVARETLSAAVDEVMAVEQDVLSTDLGTELALEVGRAYRELGEPERAIQLLDQFVDEHPADACVAEAMHLLGLLHLDRDERPKALACFRRVRALDQELERPPFALPNERVEQAAEAALLELPPELRDKLANVPIVVEEYPSLELIEDGTDPRLLGFFAGTPYGEQGSRTVPQIDCIYLFVRNIERDCEDAEQIEEEIRTTVLHEAGHFFGLSEEDLERLGLD